MITTMSELLVTTEVYEVCDVDYVNYDNGNEDDYEEEEKDDYTLGIPFPGTITASCRKHREV